MFIDDDIIHHIANCSNNYAIQDCNDTSFSTDEHEIRKFIGILILTGYNTRPMIEHYWSSNPTLGCSLVRNTMPRDRFRRIKKYFHVCNNRELDQNDKFSKVTPFNNMLNERFMQFGIFTHNLSIDEQMIAYYGRHSCKMFIKSKPIRFGFKYWDLCSAEGYLYCFFPYAGASAEKDVEYGLGASVVCKLLSKVIHPNEHSVAFDNFFTSYKLMCKLSSLGYFSTGTVRENRTSNALLSDVKTMKKKNRGEMDYAFDTNNNILMVRWNDNSVVTVASNHEGILPMHNVKRFDRKKGKMVTVEMPQALAAYNSRMGGVDLFDNAMNNYRIAIRGKKWYWPLVTNGIDAAMVNAWKLHCFLQKFADKRSHAKKSSAMSQIEFRVYVTESLLQQSKPAKYREPVLLPSVRSDQVDHVIIRSDGNRVRCRGCKKHTFFVCAKCNVALHPKCFAEFHNI